jgi:hypothetical protein
MRKTIIIIIALIAVSAKFFIITFFGIGFFSGALEFDFTPSREGDVIQTSYDAHELMKKTNFFSFLDGNIESCKWYCQVAVISGDFFLKIEDVCYNGEIVLQSDFYDIITKKYEWNIYDYAVNASSLDEFDFALIPLYKTSMIRDSLKSKQLYVCDDPIFSDNSHFTFLDKENKTLYFYWHSD